MVNKMTRRGSKPWERMSRSWKEWESLGASPWLLRTIRFGAQLPWDVNRPIRRGIRTAYPLKPTEAAFANQEVQRWVHEGFCRELGWEEARAIGTVVSAFVVPGAKDRLVVDYSPHNESLLRRPFKMEQLSDLAPLLHPGDSLLKFDIKDAYYHVRLRREDQRKLIFRVGERVFMPLCMNCGLAAAPWLFTKLMRVPLRALRQQGHRVSSYLDDFYGAARIDATASHASQGDTARAEREIRALLSRLGLTIHPRKVDFSGSRRMECLGIVVDTEIGTYDLSQAKRQKVARAAFAVMQEARRNRRLVRLPHLQHFAGLAQSTYLAVPSCRLYLREVHDCVAEALRSPRRRGRLSHQGLRDLLWWCDLPTNASVGRPIWQPAPTASLFTDANQGGWGGVWANHATARGLFDTEEGPLHINKKEVLAAILSLESFAEAARGAQIDLAMDSLVSVHVINNWTSRSPDLMALLRRLRALTEALGVSLATRHIPGVLNVWADRLSRQRDAADWKLSPRAVAAIEGQFGPHVWHHGARRETAVVPLYSSATADPGAAMRIPWGEAWPLANSLITCPPHQVWHVVRQLQRFRRDATLIVPDWPTQAWFAPARAAASAELPLGSSIPVWLHSTDGRASPWNGRAFRFLGAPGGL